MKKTLVIGSGISGIACAIECAYKGVKAVLISPYPSERAQSVLAAGGINAVLPGPDGDSIESHIEDTLKGGCFIAGKDAVRGLCEDAPDIIRWLEKLGTVFSTDEDGKIKRRAFGGQSYKRTCYCGSSTGKQIVTALVMEARRLEGAGLIERLYGLWFHSAVITDGKCHGAIFYNDNSCRFEILTANSVVMATGGQNALFGKTTGSTLCDGYSAGRLFLQGVDLKNLEFIQYHPTTIETGQKRMLISEAVRGEGGRLYYEEDGRRVYFMEDRFGSRGNLKSRDVCTRCIEETGRDTVYLDISFLEKDEILKRVPEVYELCMKYRGIDISKQSIPVSPSVHFFMGGIAVNNEHETNIRDLFAIGECASIYHGANRLGGNSLLAAIHGARVVAMSLQNCTTDAAAADFAADLSSAEEELASKRNTASQFPVMYIRDLLAGSMKENLGIVRSADRLQAGMVDVDYYLSIADKIRYDDSEPAYLAYSLDAILTLAKATFACALYRQESRGAHLRSDYPGTSDAYQTSTIISYDGGRFTTCPDREERYEH